MPPKRRALSAQYQGHILGAPSRHHPRRTPWRSSYPPSYTILRAFIPHSTSFIVRRRPSGSSPNILAFATPAIASTSAAIFKTILPEGLC